MKYREGYRYQVYEDEVFYLRFASIGAESVHSDYIDLNTNVLVIKKG